MDRSPLEEALIKNRLAVMANWSFENGKLKKEFKFTDFSEAFSL